MSGMFPVASFPCICYRTEDYHCVSVSRLFGSPLSWSIFIYEWPCLSVALTEPDADSVSLKADSQVAILALHMHRPGPGGHILDEIHELSKFLRANSLSNLQIRISWISGHDGVAGNESVNKETKAAAKGDSSPQHELPMLLQSDPLPFSTMAAKQHFRVGLAREWRKLWAKSPATSMRPRSTQSFQLGCF